MEHNAQSAREALDRLTAEQYEDPPEHRAVLLPRLIQQQRVRVAEAELQDVATELEALEAGEEARQQELSDSAADLRRAYDRHERARAADSTARQRIAAIKAGALPYRSNVLDQLTNPGQ